MGRKLLAFTLTKLGLGVGSMIASADTIVRNLNKLYGSDERIGIRVSRLLEDSVEIEINVEDETTYLTFKHTLRGSSRVITEVKCGYDL